MTRFGSLPLAVSLAAVAAPAVQATIIESLVGDRDGFNGVYDPDVQALPFRFDFSTVGADPDPSDGWTGGDDSLVSTDLNVVTSFETFFHGHNYGALPFGIVDAVIEFVVFDKGASNIEMLLVDGEELTVGGEGFFATAVGETFGGADLTFNDGAAELIAARIPPSMFPLLADGGAFFAYQRNGSPDMFAVDYSRLLIGDEAIVIPEASTFSFVTVLLLITWAVRRRGRFDLRQPGP